MTIEKQVEISQLSSFKNKGTIPKLITCTTIDSLQDALSQYPSHYILGKGSNTLINPDTNIEAFIKLSPEILPNSVSGNTLQVSAGTSVNRLLTLCKTHGLSGLEFTAGVPASLGGMVCMNFGCWGDEIADRIDQVFILTPKKETRWVPAKELDFQYRNSKVSHYGWVVLGASFSLSKSTPELVNKICKDNVEKRIAKQPLRAATFGCIFKNPKDHYAGEIIEALGFRGKELNKSLSISQEHANFMVNHGQSSFSDTITAIQMIQREALSKRNITLELEVKLVH
ncbi:UDP-N-acetylenolpyruvoylglucosamine reductase [Candidatus Marinamargulisbacteria bacterium SCGC AG-439-L15]|nr:UDP-N-acetylenolpyruvoylglucosamine reductase [Candidatus Marinamargulisbacteria bacterium SCGC AG-439-L15]